MNRVRLLNKKGLPSLHRGLIYCIILMLNLYCFLKAALAEEIIRKGEVLSLRRCIEIALKKHPSIISTIGGKRAAESRVGQAKANYYPKIEIGTTYNRSHQRVTFDQYSGNVRLNQNIYDFGRTETNVIIQRLNLDSSQAEVDTVINQVIFNVKQSYFNLIRARRNKEVAEEVVRQFEQHLLQAKGFYEAGTRPKYDVTQAEVNLSNAKVNLIKAENALRLAQLSLSNSMGVPDAQEYGIEILSNEQRGPEITFDEALSQALKNRPDLRSIISKRQSAEQSVELTKKNYNPVFSGTITYGWTGNNFPLEREWSIGGSLNIPVFDGFLTRHQVAEAEANLDTIKANEELLRQNIYMEVYQAYLNLREAKERIPAAELAVRQARENLELARGRYEAGVGNPIEVTDAEVSYVNANASYIQAVTDYQIAIAELERAMGKGLEAIPQ